MEEIVQKVHRKYEEAVKDIFKIGATTTASLNEIIDQIKKGVNRETNFYDESSDSEYSSEDESS